MYEDLIRKPKKLTVDDITWDKNCSNCEHSSVIRAKLSGSIYCLKDNSHKLKDYFCYDWEKINT